MASSGAAEGEVAHLGLSRNDGKQKQGVLNMGSGTFFSAEPNNVTALGVSDISFGLKSYSSCATLSWKCLGNILKT